jgi:hypothetical protein
MTTPDKWLFGVWAIFAVLAGTILTSYHQPFRSPSPAILRLARPSISGRTRAIHILSASCACSQRVMQHLLERRPLLTASEQVLILDGPAPDLPNTRQLIAKLTEAGFSVRELPSTDVPPEAALRGVPLLIFASPTDQILYMGGYGPAYDQDQSILERIDHQQTVQPLAAIGCAVSRSLRRQADPFHLKY